MRVVVDGGVLPVPIDAAVRNVAHLPERDWLAGHFNQARRRPGAKLDPRVDRVGDRQAIQCEEVQMDGRLERRRGDAPDATGVLGHRHRAASRGRRRGEPVSGERDGRGLRRTNSKRDRAIRVHLGRDKRILRSTAAAGRRRRRGGGRLRHLSGDKLAESERAGSERRNPATCHRAPDSSGVRRFLAARARLGRRDPILRAGARLCHLSTGTRHHRPLRRGILGASTGTSLFNAVARSI